MAYSYDLRSKALDYIEKNGSKLDASRIFGVTVRTLLNWIKRKEKGCLAPKRTKDKLILQSFSRHQEHILCFSL